MALAGELSDRYETLRSIILPLGRVIVAYSGGVDSALLAKVAHDVLGTGALAVTAASPSLPQRELKFASAVAEHVGFAHRVIQTAEMADTRYTDNPANRCYFCKTELFGQLRALAEVMGIPGLLYGENVDDQRDHRPGAVAAAEHGVRAPLKEAGLGKADIRAIARQLDIPVWDKPAFACLASRFPTGVEITPGRLAQVEACEDVLSELGFRQFRVRYHGEVARIEVDPTDRVRLLSMAEEIVIRFQQAGFRHVAMDLMGYQRGGAVVVFRPEALSVLD